MLLHVYWPVLFCVFIDLDEKNRIKELGQYLAVLTPRLTNNTCVYKLHLV